MFNNNTRNQHYISQVEQKLNCINPSIAKEKRRIYQFESLNRESQEYKLSNESGVKIEKNLSFNDLYSLEVFDDATRDNFEHFFSELESKIENLTQKVLTSQKIDKEILITLFNAKLMNVIRNPYCILSTLNTYSDICEFTPVDDKLAQYFQKIKSLRINEFVLKEFKVDQEQFRQWLKIIFYLVVPINCPNGKYLNFMPDMINKLFDIKDFLIFIAIVTHEKQICLLSDRAHVDLSKALPKDAVGYEFNLTKNAFMHITFSKNNLESIPNIPDHIIKAFRKQGINKITQPAIRINKISNDNKLFSAYNARVIYQCHRYFYAADKSFLK